MTDVFNTPGNTHTEQTKNYLVLDLKSFSLGMFFVQIQSLNGSSSSFRLKLLAPQKVKLTNNTACFCTLVSCLYTSIILRGNTVVKNTFHYNCSLLCKQVAQLSRRVIRLSYIAQCAYAYIGTSLSLSFTSFEKYS